MAYMIRDSEAVQVRFIVAFPKVSWVNGHVFEFFLFLLKKPMHPFCIFNQLPILKVHAAIDKNRSIGYKKNASLFDLHVF